MLYAKKYNSENANDSLTRISGFVRPHAKVLDAGCACGALAQALNRDKGCKVHGLDYNPESVAYGKSLGVFERVECCDLNNLTAAGFPEYAGAFDYVVCGDVLEHLINPAAALAVLKTYLRPDGEMIISLPNVAHGSIKANLLLDDFTYTDLGILDKTHLHFYTWRSITVFLAENGLEIAEAQAVTLPLDGWQPHTLKELPSPVADYIRADKHSYIMQYVMRCRLKKSAAATVNMHKLDALALDKNEKANIMFRIKRQVITKFPFLLKYLEILRLRR